MALKARKPETAKPSKPKVLIYGAPGVGKTWTALDFPSVYYIDTEGGANLPHYTDKLAKSGGAYLGPEDGACSFEEVTEQIKALATTMHPYKTVVIDSYSKLFMTKVAETLEAMGKKRDLSEGTYGAEKREAIQWTRQWLRWFNTLDMNVILICHERDLWADGKSVGKTFDGWDKMAYELHLALHISKAGPARKAKVVKSRLEAFPDAESFDWSYAAFAERFGKDLLESAPIVTAIATPEQIAEYQQLFNLVRLPEKVRERWAEVEDVADMTEADMQRRIDYLKQQLEGVRK